MSPTKPSPSEPWTPIGSGGSPGRNVASSSCRHRRVVSGRIPAATSYDVRSRSPTRDASAQRVDEQRCVPSREIGADRLSSHDRGHREALRQEQHRGALVQLIGPRGGQVPAARDQDRVARRNRAHERARGIRSIGGSDGSGFGAVGDPQDRGELLVPCLVGVDLSSGKSDAGNGVDAIASARVAGVTRHHGDGRRPPCTELADGDVEHRFVARVVAVDATDVADQERPHRIAFTTSRRDEHRVEEPTRDIGADARRRETVEDRVATSCAGGLSLGGMVEDEPHVRGGGVEVRLRPAGVRGIGSMTGADRHQLERHEKRRRGVHEREVPGVPVVITGLPAAIAAARLSPKPSQRWSETKQSLNSMSAWIRCGSR